MIAELQPDSLRDPDTALMLRVQAEEPGAFQELVSRYWSRLFGRFYRQLGDRQEAEDLAQDVFLRIYRNRHRYRPAAKFATWAYHIAQNVLRNALRSRRRRPTMALPFLDGDESPFQTMRGEGDGDRPSTRLERHEVARLVRSAVATLKGARRRAVELQCLDHSYGEIAAKLDMTAEAAKSLLYRARNELRESLEPLAESLI